MRVAGSAGVPESNSSWLTPWEVDLTRFYNLGVSRIGFGKFSLVNQRAFWLQRSAA
jgi:hypothetical protein